MEARHLKWVEWDDASKSDVYEGPDGTLYRVMCGEKLRARRASEVDHVRALAVAMRDAGVISAKIGDVELVLGAAPAMAGAADQQDDYELAKADRAEREALKLREYNATLFGSAG